MKLSLTHKTLVDRLAVFISIHISLVLFHG